MDWDIRSSRNIQRQVTTINSELALERDSLKKMTTYLSNAKAKYSQLDSETKMKTQSDVGLAATKADIITLRPIKEYISISDILGDAAGSAMLLGAAIKSGFNIKQVGDYIHIFGKRAPRSAAGFPLGTRVKIGSDVYIGNSYALWFKNATVLDRLKSSFSDFGKNTFGIKDAAGKTNVGAIFGYLGIAADTISGFVGNVKNGASTSKILADATTDVAKGLGKMAATSAGASVGAAVGAAIGSIFPGAGTVIGGCIGKFAGGVIAGFAYDYLIDGGVQIGGKSVADWVSNGLEFVNSKVGDAVKSGAKAVANVATEAAKNIANAAKKVGDAVQSTAKSVKNFFKKLF